MSASRSDPHRPESNGLIRPAIQAEAGRDHSDISSRDSPQGPPAAFGKLTEISTHRPCGSSHLLRTLQKMRPAGERSLIHIEWRRLSRTAPFWSPVKNLKIPVIAIGNRPRRWEKIPWRKGALLAEIRVQKRRLFPRAPKWSPLHDLELPALRLTRRSLSSLPAPRAGPSSRSGSRGST